MNTSVRADRQQTIEALLARSKRRSDAVPIRWTFVQQGVQREPRPGPLRALVHRGAERALELYLLLHAIASSPPWDATEDARIWARALGLYLPGGRRENAGAISKTWRQLEDLRLVRRERDGRLARVTLLREDGHGGDYEQPSGAADDPYLQLPYDYWREGWHLRLKLADKAMLLIASTQPAGFALAHERVPGWYGLSADTAERGLRRLKELGVLDVHYDTKPAPLAPEGFTKVPRYTLQSPFRGRRPARASTRGPAT